MNMEKNKKAVLLFSWAAKVAFNLTGGSFLFRRHKEDSDAKQYGQVYLETLYLTRRQPYNSK